MNKKAIELSVNFIVMLVLGIVVFGMGVAIFYTIMDKAVKWNDQVQADIAEKELNEMLRYGDLFKIINPQLTVKKKDTAVAHLGIRNELGSNQEFTIRLAQKIDDVVYPVNYPLPAGIAATDPAKAWPKEQVMLSDSYTLKNKEGTVRLLGFDSKNMKPGRYTFLIVACVDNSIVNPLAIDEDEYPYTKICESSGKRYAAPEPQMIFIDVV